MTNPLAGLKPALEVLACLAYVSHVVDDEERDEGAQCHESLHQLQARR